MLKNLIVIAGQKAVITKAKISEAGFKIRQGMPVGVRVTLRGKRMWEFFDRFCPLRHPVSPTSEVSLARVSTKKAITHSVSPNKVFFPK